MHEFKSGDLIWFTAQDETDQDEWRPGIYLERGDHAAFSGEPFHCIAMHLGPQTPWLVLTIDLQGQGHLLPREEGTTMPPTSILPKEI